MKGRDHVFLVLGIKYQEPRARLNIGERLFKLILFPFKVLYLFYLSGLFFIHISLELTIYWAPDINAIEVNKNNILKAIIQ